ncbi:hypothetical protein SUGI_1203200 [Cryptomeria japonica]|nr:hypothetical protein SUGI_1203200 [Cryptomeria japonica]
MSAALAIALFGRSRDDDDEAMAYRFGIKPGDHIYTFRMGTAYSHHGIYVGKNRVIHFTNDNVRGKGGLFVKMFGYISSSSPCEIACPRCGHQRDKSGVIMTCIDCFRVGGQVHRYEYGIVASNAPPGTYTRLQSSHPNKAISRAMDKLRHGYGKYDLLRKNCEHFALYCKTENAEAESGQVRAVVEGIAQVIGNFCVFFNGLGRPR